MAPLLYIYNVYNLNNGIFSRKRLQERLQCFASEKGKAGTEIASPILYKRKGEERFTIWGTGSPWEFAQPF